MIDGASTEIVTLLKNWISNSAATKQLGSHASVVRNVTADLIGQHDLLLKNSRTRPAVAIFGPSQAGKSYLTAKICERHDKSVGVDIDKTYDFLREINPAGGRESTALVTRMTTVRGKTRHPKTNSVNAKVLSLPDLIGVFVNIYSNDLKRESDIRRENVLNRIESVCGKEVLDQVHNTDIIIDPSLVYLQRILAYLPLDFRPFTDLFRLPSGSLDGKSARELTELFAVMWGDINELNLLFEHVCEYLIILNFAPSIQIPVEAFVPREESIIDVAILSNIQITDQYSEHILEVTTENGDLLELPKPILCCLISEVEFVLNSPEAGLLESVDILDFPGARSRIRRDIQQYEEGGVDKLFLRGKISHLFESASLRDEIDALLLCVKPGPMDIATLPDTIRRWLDGVAEDQITRRLFILATQFDLHFPDAAGQSKGDQEKFDNALFSAVLEPFAPSEDSWIYKFNFTNIYPIRNPNYPYNGFFNYEKNGQEVSVREDALERIEELKNAFVTSTNVKNYVSDIPKKWKSLMTPSDGGADLLISDLTSVDWSQLKKERLASKQREIFKQVRSSLEPFVVYDDVSKKLKQEKQNFLRHFLTLQQVVDQRNLASLAELFAVNPLDLKASVSSDILTSDEQKESPSSVSGVQIPSFLSGEISGESVPIFQTPQEQFFDKLVSALIVALLEELDNNIKNCSKSLMQFQDALIYFCSQFTNQHQLEKIREKLVFLSSDWSAGLKLTDNLEPLCMIASKVFEDHFFGVSINNEHPKNNVMPNSVVSAFEVEKATHGSAKFFNAWMEHVGKLIEENVVNASGGAYDLNSNNQLLLTLEKINEHAEREVYSLGE